MLHELKKVMLLLAINQLVANAQAPINYQRLVDSLRTTYHIPGLWMGVVRPDSVLFCQSFGVKRVGATEATQPTDLIALGSCTKSVTGLVAARLVRAGKLRWNTRLFALLPDLRPDARRDYDPVTLEQLLAHRAGIKPLTGQNGEVLPDAHLLTDTSPRARINLARWVLNLAPVRSEKPYIYSNAGYTLAALMLERASGLTWEQLVDQELQRVGIRAYFTFPNELNTANVWLHDEGGLPVAPHENSEAGVRAGLAPGGLVFVTFTDALRYVQLHLRGELGQSDYLSPSEFRFIHCGLPEYAIGWGCKDVDGRRNIMHRGNLGGRSWCLLQLIPAQNIGIALCTNVGDKGTGDALLYLRDQLVRQFARP